MELFRNIAFLSVLLLPLPILEERHFLSISIDLKISLGTYIRQEMFEYVESTEYEGIYSSNGKVPCC